MSRINGKGMKRMEKKKLDYIMLPVDFCEQGDLLGEDVFTEAGQLVLSKGTILTPEFIEKLKALDIFSVRIEFNNASGHSDLYINDNHKEMVDAAYNTLDKIMSMLANRKPVAIKEYEKELTDLLQATVSSGEIVDILREVQQFDDYLYKHSIAVGIYSVMLASWMGFEEKEIKNIGLAGLLHDIGMTKIEREILNKPGSLLPRQREMMERHVKFSHDIVKFSGFHDIGLLQAIIQHHERTDGSGYPSHIKGDSIHPYANILAVADCYHAMTSDRPYRKKMSHTDALKVLWRDAFNSLDPKTVLTFINGMMGKYSGRLCKMSNGQAGRVVFINRDDPIHPIVKVGKGDDSRYIDMRFDKNMRIQEIL